MPDRQTCPCGSGVVYDECCSSLSDYEGEDVVSSDYEEGDVASSDYEGVDSIELFEEIVRSDKRRRRVFSAMGELGRWLPGRQYPNYMNTDYGYPHDYWGPEYVNGARASDGCYWVLCTECHSHFEVEESRGEERDLAISRFWDDELLRCFRCYESKDMTGEYVPICDDICPICYWRILFANFSDGCKKCK